VSVWDANIKKQAAHLRELLVPLFDLLFLVDLR
jgi:hypothetical protein